MKTLKLKLKRKVKKLLMKFSSLLPRIKENQNGLFRSSETLHALAEQVGKSYNNNPLIIKRIIESYQLAIQEKDDRGDSMWQIFFEQRHIPIHNIFKNGQIEQAEKIFQNPGTSDLFYGFDNLMQSFQSELDTDPNKKQPHAAVCLDVLVRFAEAIGAIRIDNPEGHLDFSVSWNSDDIIKRIEQTLGQKLSFPNPYLNEHGVWSSKGIISYRVSQALYQAWRIKELLKNITNPRVLEIGAGLGRTAYYSRMFGIQDYTIIDLPFSLISSGHFLASSLGENQVALYGENIINKEQRVKILPPNEFLKNNDKYDLIINVDSFTEMDSSIAQSYWKKIAQSTDCFLSINHENNKFTVRELINSDQKVKQSYRYPYWMRKGYVEEVIRFN